MLCVHVLHISWPVETQLKVLHRLVAPVTSFNSSVVSNAMGGRARAGATSASKRRGRGMMEAAQHNATKGAQLSTKFAALVQARGGKPAGQPGGMGAPGTGPKG
eukprot:EG_transcript_30046